MMPEIDGFEFAKEIRRMFPEIPIIFITARDDFESKRKGFESGIDDYMVKPILLPELKMRIEAILRRSKINSDKKITVGSLILVWLFYHFKKCTRDLKIFRQGFQRRL